MRAPKTKTEIRREQIAQVALALVARHGLRAMNLAALAGEVGVVPSAIYRHYPSKEAVLDAVLDLIRRRLLENVENVRRDFISARDRLDQLLRRHVDMILHNQGIPRVVFSEEIFGGPPTRRRQVYQVIEDYLDRVANLVREGQERGEFRPGPPPETVARMFLGLVQTASVLRLMSDGAFDAARYRESAWELLSEMIAAPT